MRSRIRMAGQSLVRGWPAMLLFAIGSLAAQAAAGQQAPSGAPGQESSSALSTLTVERVERYLEGRAACRGCHVIAGNGGAIGPVLDGIADRADATYVLSVIRDPAGTIPGTIMPHRPMPSADAERLARYLMSLPARPSPDVTTAQAPPALEPGQELVGEALYARHCAACHGASGQGDGWNAASLPVRPTAHADPRLMSERPDDTLFDGIAAGGYVLDRSARMPGFGRLLTPAQIRALVSHIRVLCGCEQPAWARGG